MRRKDIMRSTQLAGRVVRWHTWPMIRKPTVAEHTSRVATLYVELWGMPRAEVLYYCLCHDHGELTAGDNPFSSKALVPGLRENLNEAERIGRERLGITLPDLTQEEFLRFKVCDLGDMFEVGVVERNMGNRYAICVVQDCATEMYALGGRLDDLEEVATEDRPFRSQNFNHIHQWIHSNGYSEGERS